jgi:isopentenyl-diphosphate Delta-isomerase
MRDLGPEDLIPAWNGDSLVPMDKLAVHLQGIRHQAVSVFVMEGPRVLIQRRAFGKYHTPGLWANTCCTHPLWGEDSAACATRRLQQELGIEGVYPSFADRVEYRADVGGGMVEHEVVDIFVAAVPPGLRVSPNPAEVAEVRWVDLYDLQADVTRNPDGYTPWLRIYLAEHMARIFGVMAR